MAHKFTKEQADFIKTNVKGTGNDELTQMFNSHFKLNLKVSQIKAFKKNNKLSSGLDGYFQKGHVPFNKGKKGNWGYEPTQFKKGHKPHNYAPVGSERVNGDGYVDIKVADPNKWRGKHLVIWEEHNGPVPEGYAVIFGDGNDRNFDINNLIRVSRKQLLILNRNKLIQNNIELTKSGIIVADVISKMQERKKAISESRKLKNKN